MMPLQAMLFHGVSLTSVIANLWGARDEALSFMIKAYPAVREIAVNPNKSVGVSLQVEWIQHGNVFGSAATTFDSCTP